MSAPFNPSQPQTDAILDALTAPGSTLHAVASQLSISVRVLSDWLSTPAIRALMESIQDTVLRVCRVQVASTLPLAVTVNLQTLHEFLNAPRPDPSNRAAVEEHRHFAESARRASSLLTRIATLTEPRPSKPTPAAASTPKATEPPAPRATHSGSEESVSARTTEHPRAASTPNNTTEDAPRAPVFTDHYLTYHPAEHQPTTAALASGP